VVTRPLQEASRAAAGVELDCHYGARGVSYCPPVAPPAGRRPWSASAGVVYSPAGSLSMYKQPNLAHQIIRREIHLWTLAHATVARRERSAGGQVEGLIGVARPC
jgi:hypothetical protein